MVTPVSCGDMIPSLALLKLSLLTQLTEVWPFSSQWLDKKLNIAWRTKALMYQIYAVCKLEHISKDMPQKFSMLY